ncbi:MAG: 3-dehydroquinate synthase [archaeon]
MRKITVDLGKRKHTVLVGTGLLGRVEQENAVCITNPTVRKLHGSFLKCPILEIGDSEMAKSLETVKKLCEELVELGANRGTALIALGGGVVGDTTGMAAASFMRGVPLIQVPTTLLAQVDSSIGGKVGVNLLQGKNLVGAFKQPKLVVSDVSLLKTLPEKEMQNGLAEVVKTAIVGDAGLFELIELELDQIMEKDETLQEEIVARCVKVKARIVEQDELEQRGERMKLNLGHTFGHAIEKLSNCTIPHGEAVAMGLVKAAELSGVEVERIRNLLERIGLPTETEFTDEELREAMKVDKKKQGEKIRVVVPKSIGEVEVRYL